MRIESKFLTADAEVLSMRLEARQLVLEGRVKGFMPMVIRVGVDDARAFARLLGRAATDAVTSRLRRARPGAPVSEPAPRPT